MGEVYEMEAMELDKIEECPVKQVEMTVPKTDDPTLPAITFRMWVLGLGSCVVLSFVNQFFWYRKMPLMITSVSAMISVVPLGHLMAKTLPHRVFFENTGWEFTMNPGPFNMKEHVLITIFANSGAGTVYATHILSAVKLYYKRKLTFIPALLVMLTTQVLGFGWAGIFRKYLVEPGEMWWPSNLGFARERKSAKRWNDTESILSARLDLQLCLLCSPWLSLQYIDIILLGLLVGSQGGFGPTTRLRLEGPWSWFFRPRLGYNFLVPGESIAIGFFLVMYVMTPLSYWFDVYKAKNFPIYSSQLFKYNGEKYDILSIVNPMFHLDKETYRRNGRVHLSTFFTMTYGIGFATLTATIFHVLLFDGRNLWQQTKSAFGGEKKMDIHTKLMKRYKLVPTWWFVAILVLNLALILFTCEYYNETLQLPWWGVLLACAIAFFFTLPIGIIAATTNQAPGLNVITEYVIGYIYPEHPVANMCFKVYGYISVTQALTFVLDFKLGHYMKIPPRSMFTAQVVGTLVAVFVYTITAWWLMEEIPNLCDTSLLPPDSPWTCPMDNVFFDASVIWGLVGPRRIFGTEGEYGNVNWFFLGGALAPLLVWLAHKTFPDKEWIRLIHMPVLLGATAMMPPATAVNFTSWLFIAFLFGYVVYKYRPDWWKRYNYVLSGGLDAGTAFMTVLLFLTLQSKDIGLEWWGNNGEGCPLAACPTAKGIIVDGCPIT
ncbi:hypothetical protein V6N11_078625 [Hibiscus sabdariffa]|uniref:Oligopeptide transporter 6 n=1 Tax=Hibiscus sabdariffa TaxID=183260 RepID=A0ABR2TGL6_9ROSI